jgi:hypothetical protein
VRVSTWAFLYALRIPYEEGMQRRVSVDRSGCIRRRYLQVKCAVDSSHCHIPIHRRCCDMKRQGLAQISYHYWKRNNEPTLQQRIKNQLPHTPQSSTSSIQFLTSSKLFIRGPNKKAIALLGPYIARHKRHSRRTSRQSFCYHATIEMTTTETDQIEASAKVTH